MNYFYMHESQRQTAEQVKPHTKEHILYDSFYIKFTNRSNLPVREMVSSRGDNDWEVESKRFWNAVMLYFFICVVDISLFNLLNFVKLNTDNLCAFHRCILEC